MASDARDILGLEPRSQDSKIRAPKPSKKKPPGAQSNLSKEVLALTGERDPPVIIQTKEHYKKQYTVKRKAQAWVWKEFDNPGRKDGMKLSHWVKKALESNGSDIPAQAKTEQYYFSKYNYKSAVPQYTDGQYDQHFVSTDWSRQETDYLFSLARTYDLRWSLIFDRYEFEISSPEPTEDQPAALMTRTSPRTMEEMKARYYTVAAKTITLTHPQAQMTEAEFEMHDRMIKYDPERETRRKAIATGLLSRLPEEIKEEEILLSELRRITAHEEKFLEDRKELYARLDYPVAQLNTSLYDSAQGLQALAQGLMSNDRNKKRKSLADASSPAQGMSTPTTARDRGSHSGQPGSAALDKKKGGPPQPIRNLTAEEEKKFGVSTHERLNSGVSFRSGRVEKLILAKSQIQSAKVQDAVKELGIPVRPRMPTIAVCSEYERLITGIHALLDARKMVDKINNEIKIVKAQKGVDQDDGKDDTKIDEDADAEGEEEEAVETEKKEESDAEDEPDESKVEQENENDDDGDGEAEAEQDEEPSKIDADFDDPDADEAMLNDNDNDEEEEEEAASPPESPPADEDEEEEDEAEEEAEEEEEPERPTSSRASIARSTKSARTTTTANKHKRSASAMSVSESEKSTATRTSKRARKNSSIHER